MIYAPSYSLIFVHLAKNGGTSIRSHFETISETGCTRNFLTDIMFNLPFQQAPENLGFPPHQPARQIRAKLGPEIFDKSFSFAIVRNPFDRVVSSYLFKQQSVAHHRHNWTKSVGFEKYLKWEKWTNRNFSRTQFSDLSDRRGNLLVSRVYRFEEMDAILPDVCKEIGFAAPDTIPHLNPSIRNPYAEYYSEASKRLVTRIFAKDLDKFGYTF